MLKTYHGTNCANATNLPCWVPQIKDMVKSETQRNLAICPTIMDYNCEKKVLWQSMVDAGYKCLSKRPCERLSYKLIKKEELPIPEANLESESSGLTGETYTQYDTGLILTFPTQTVLKHKEKRVWQQLLTT